MWEWGKRSKSVKIRNTIEVIINLKEDIKIQYTLCKPHDNYKRKTCSSYTDYNKGVKVYHYNK